MESSGKSGKGGKRKNPRKTDEVTESGDNIKDAGKANEKEETNMGDKKARRQKADNTSKSKSGNDGSCPENKRRKQSAVSNTTTKLASKMKKETAQDEQVSNLKTAGIASDKLLQEKQKNNEQCCQDKTTNQDKSTKNTVKKVNCKRSPKQKKSDENLKDVTKAERKPVVKTVSRNKEITDAAAKKVVSKRKNKRTNNEPGIAQLKGSTTSCEKKEKSVDIIDAVVPELNTTENIKQDSGISDTDITSAAENISPEAHSASLTSDKEVSIVCEHTIIENESVVNKSKASCNDGQPAINYSKMQENKSEIFVGDNKTLENESKAADIDKALGSISKSFDSKTPENASNALESEITHTSDIKKLESDSRTIENDRQTPESDKIPENNSKTLESDKQIPESDMKKLESDLRTPENDRTTLETDKKIAENDSKTLEGDKKIPENNRKTPESDCKTPGKDSKKLKSDSKAADSHRKALKINKKALKTDKLHKNDRKAAINETSDSKTKERDRETLENDTKSTEIDKAVSNNSSHDIDSINGHQSLTDKQLSAHSEVSLRNNLTDVSSSVSSAPTDAPTASDNRLFACSHCAYRAKHRVQLRRHLGTHGVHECAHCTFVSSSSVELHAHLRAVHPGRCDRKRCPQCGRVVPAAQMQQHSESCTGELQPWKCTICQREFRYECQLRVHLRTHDVKSTDSSVASIAVSDAPISNDDNNIMSSDKSSDKNTPADTAVDVSSSSTVLHTTISSTTVTHTDEPCLSTSSSSSTHAASIPPVTTTATSSRHTTTPSQLRAFSCDFAGCSETFAKRMLLVEHKQYTHGIVRQFACEHPGCNLRFAKKSQLTRHGIVHTDERNFLCKWPGCNKAFRHSDNLRVHFRRHSNSQPIRCEICSFSCHQHNSLKYHMDSEHSSSAMTKTVTTTTDVLQSLTTQLAEFANTTSMAESDKVPASIGLTPHSDLHASSVDDASSTQIVEKQEVAVYSTNTTSTTTTTTTTTSTSSTTTSSTTTTTISSESTSKPDIYDFNDDDDDDKDRRSMLIRPKLAGRSPGSSSLESNGDASKITQADQKTSPDVTASTLLSVSNGKERKSKKGVKEKQDPVGQRLSKPLKKKKAGVKSYSGAVEKDGHLLKNKMINDNDDMVDANDDVTVNKKSLPKNKNVAQKKSKTKKDGGSRKRLSAEDGACDPSKKLCFTNDVDARTMSVEHARELSVVKTADVDECAATTTTTTSGESDVTMQDVNSDSNMLSGDQCKDVHNTTDNDEKLEDTASMSKMAVDDIPHDSTFKHDYSASTASVDNANTLAESSYGNDTAIGEQGIDERDAGAEVDHFERDVSPTEDSTEYKTGMLESQPCTSTEHIDQKLDSENKPNDVGDTTRAAAVDEQTTDQTVCDDSTENTADNMDSVEVQQDNQTSEILSDNTAVQQYRDTIVTDNRLLESPVSHLMSQKEVDELSIPSIPNGSPGSDFGADVVAMSADAFKESNDLCSTTEPFVMSPANAASLPGTPNSIELPDDAAMFGVGVPVITASSQSKLDDMMCRETANDPTEQLAVEQSPPFTLPNKNDYGARELYGDAPSYGVMDKPVLSQEAEVSHQAYPANNAPYTSYPIAPVERPSVLTPNPAVPPTPEYSPPQNIFPVPPIGQSASYGCTGSMTTAGDAYSSSPHPSFLLDSQNSKMHESLHTAHDPPTYSFGRDVDVTSGKSLPAPCFPPDSFTPKDFFSQYFSGQDPSTLPLSHLPTQQDQRLGYTQRSSFDMLPRAPMLPTPAYGTESLITPGMVSPAWGLDDRVRPAWPQPTSLVPPTPSQLGRAPSFSRSDFGFDASRGLAKHAEAFSMPQPVADPYNPYIPRPFTPAVSYARPPAGSGQKHLEDAYRHPDYRGLPGADLYGRMGVNPPLGLDKYYYQRDAMYRQPFMPPVSNAQSPYPDYTCTPYAQHSAAAAAAAAAAYGLMGDKQYLTSAVKMADNVASLPDRNISSATTGDYLQGQRPADTHIQDQYHRSVIYNMMSRYY